MTTIIFDTLKYAKRLESVGVSPQQAEAMAEAQQEVFAQALDTQVATKADIVRLEAKFDYELRLLKWMVGLSLAASTAIFSLLLRWVLGAPHP